VIDCNGLHELLGAQAAPVLEQLLAVRGAEPQVLRKPLQWRLLGPRLGQEGDGAPDQLVVRRAIGAGRVRPSGVAMSACGSGRSSGRRVAV
jgi:hypothetical protein